MKRRWSLLAVALSVAGLSAATLGTALLSAGGSPEGAVIAAPSQLRSPLAVHPFRGGCSPARGSGASTIRLAGACNGAIAAGFACVGSDESRTLSVRVPIGGRNALLLTIVVDGFDGPGVYPEADAFAQIAGPAESPRWTRRGLQVRIGPSGAAELGSIQLAPEPGTPASGRITLGGSAACNRVTTPGR